jgi:hypothetical protein
MISHLSVINAWLDNKGVFFWKVNSGDVNRTFTQQFIIIIIICGMRNVCVKILKMYLIYLWDIVINTYMIIDFDF